MLLQPKYLKESVTYSVIVIQGKLISPFGERASHWPFRNIVGQELLLWNLGKAALFRSPSRSQASPILQGGKKYSSFFGHASKISNPGSFSSLCSCYEGELGYKVPLGIQEPLTLSHLKCVWGVMDTCCDHKLSEIQPLQEKKVKVGKRRKLLTCSFDMACQNKVSEVLLWTITLRGSS